MSSVELKPLGLVNKTLPPCSVVGFLQLSMLAFHCLHLLTRPYQVISSHLLTSWWWEIYLLHKASFLTHSFPLSHSHLYRKTVQKFAQSPDRFPKLSPCLLLLPTYFKHTVSHGNGGMLFFFFFWHLDVTT
jgi:hypothetical protein